MKSLQSLKHGREGRRDSVIIEGDLVRKCSEPVALKLEMLKMQAAARIAERSGLFVVPQIVEFDANLGELTMTRLEQLKPLRSLRGAHTDELARFHQAGSALATIHHRLRLPRAWRVALPDSLDSLVHPRIIHGDFSKQNVGLAIQKGRPCLAIIDWQLSRMYGGNASTGPACFDAAWFISGLFMEPPHRLSGHWHIAEKARTFIDGYLSSCRDGPSRAELLCYSRQLHAQRQREFRRCYSLTRRLALKPGFMMWRRFLDRFPAAGCPGPSDAIHSRNQQQGEVSASRRTAGSAA